MNQRRYTCPEVAGELREDVLKFSYRCCHYRPLARSASVPR